MNIDYVLLADIVVEFFCILAYFLSSFSIRGWKRGVWVCLFHLSISFCFTYAWNIFVWCTRIRISISCWRIYLLSSCGVPFCVCCLHWVISIVLSLNSLILSSVPSILLLIPSIEFWKLVVIVFGIKISIWFMYSPFRWDFLFL